MELKYLPHVDGLRAIAVLLVIMFHVSPGFIRGGFVGVDIFFVISGYLLSGIILRELKRDSFSFKNFYIRRIKRIFPSLLVVLFASLIFGWFSLFSEEYKSLAKHIMAAATFISNIIYWQEVNYFAVSSEFKPLLHLWSLGVEEQFYLMWPVLLVLLYKLKNRKQIFIGISILIIFSFVLNLLPFIKFKDAFYFPFMRFWEFLLGALVAYVFLHENESFIKNKIVKNKYLSVVGVLSIAFGVYIIEKDILNVWWMLFPVLGSVCIIISDKDNWFNRKILANRIIVFIGLISYPLYLWHWPLLSFANIIKSGSVSFYANMILVAFSFLLAWLTYRFVEKPIRSNSNKKIPLILIILLIFVGICGLIVFSNKGFKFRFLEKEKLLATANGGGPSYDEKCKKIYKDKLKNTHCLVNGTGEKKIFIVGDSHTTAIFMAYNKSLVKRGYTVTALGQSACPLLLPLNVIDENVSSSKEKEKYKNCAKIMGDIMKEVSEQKPYGIIFVNNGWSVYGDLYKEGMMNNFSLVPKGTKIIWFLQHPHQPRNYYLKCLDRPFSFGENIEDCSFPISNVLEQRKGYEKIVSEILEKYPNVQTIDSVKSLCDKEKCNIRIKDSFLYDAADHLSWTGINILSKSQPLDKYFPQFKK